jgi:hypothetical protein
MANTTWSATDKTAGITLTNGNLTATNNNNAASGLRAVDRQITGKFYWEVTCTVFTWNGNQVGFVSPTWLLTNLPSNTPLPGTCVLQQTGQVNIDDVVVGSSFGTITAGTVICIAIDYDARRVWFRLGAGGNWNMLATANPATGAGGFAISLGLGIAALPAVWLGNTNDQITANFGATAFTGVVPSGFTSGFTAGVTTPTNALDTATVIEEFITYDAFTTVGQFTQVSAEVWGVGTAATQMAVTQSSIEVWGSVAFTPLGGGAQARAMVMA